MMYTPIEYVYAVNLKFNMNDQLKAMLSVFPLAEELVLFSKPAATFETALGQAADFSRALCDSLEKKKLGKYGVHIKRNQSKISMEIGDEGTFEPADWREDELMKIWVYDFTDKNDPIAVCLTQVMQRQSTTSHTLN
jgi:hypothetical protein